VGKKKKGGRKKTRLKDIKGLGGINSACGKAEKMVQRKEKDKEWIGNEDTQGQG